MIASQFRQLRDFFRSREYRHSLLITGGAFAALIVLAFAAGLIFPAVPAQVLTLFSQQMADAGGSVRAAASVCRRCSGTTYGPWCSAYCTDLSLFIYLPALSLGVNALLLGLFAAYFLNNGISILAYLGASCPTASLNCRRWSSVWPLRHLPVQPHQPVCPQKHQGHNGSPR